LNALELHRQTHDSSFLAVAIQQVLLRHNSDLPTERRMEFRMGINLGDVVAHGEDRLGHGVNVAARLQEIAEPSAICISATVRDQVEGKLNFPLQNLGER
jgi:adenylate cyclase